MTDRLVLASTSPQRRAILEQLRVPFETVPPTFEERDDSLADPVELVRGHALGKARSVHMEGAVTLGVDTTVHLDGRVHAKPEDAAGAERMLGELSGRRHSVLSGLCLLGPGFERLEHAETFVSFRSLTDGDVRAYIASGEWQGRAGGYAIQGLGGRFVAQVHGDYLNVVGLPGSLLVELLEEHAPNLLQIAGN
jgi:septum formation protein